MITKLYGSLQGPVIPDSVDREHLPLGRQRLKLLRLINETKSKDQSSVSYTFLTVSADAGIRGTAFFRFNFRDVSFKLMDDANPPNVILDEVFPEYFDASFVETSLTRLGTLTQDVNPVIAKAADRELNRARIALSTTKKLNTMAGVGNARFFDANKWVGLEFEGIIQYRDKGGVTKRLKADGTVEYYSKSLRDVVHENAYDETTASADVTSIYAARVDTPVRAVDLASALIASR